MVRYEHLPIEDGGIKQIKGILVTTFYTVYILIAIGR